MPEGETQPTAYQRFVDRVTGGPWKISLDHVQKTLDELAFGPEELDNPRKFRRAFHVCTAGKTSNPPQHSGGKREGTIREGHSRSRRRGRRRW